MSFEEAMLALVRQVEADMRTAFGWGDDITIYVNDARIPENESEYGEVEVSILDVAIDTPQSDRITVQVEVSARFPEPSSGLRYDFQIGKVAALRALMTPSLSIDGRTGYGEVDGAPLLQSVMVSAIDLQDLEANETYGVEVGVTMTGRLKIRRAEA